MNKANWITVNWYTITPITRPKMFKPDEYKTRYHLHVFDRMGDHSEVMYLGSFKTERDAMDWLEANSVRVYGRNIVLIRVAGHTHLLERVQDYMLIG